MRLSDLARLALPLGAKRREALAAFAEHVSEKELADVKYLLKTRAVGVHYDRFGTRDAFFPDRAWPVLSAASEESAPFVERVNEKVRDGVQLAAFQVFARTAMQKTAALVAPRIQGLEPVKLAAAAQLFCMDPIHILLIGDPGTGKTEVLRSVELLAPVAVFGLGSGASKAGLVGSFEGKEFRPGVLVQADEGVALLDELNLLKKEDRGGLYSAMEKGFVTLDKGGRHAKRDARVRVLATANPKGDRFRSRNLKVQLPFEHALLSRFHLVFVVRAPDAEAFERIARGIVREESAALPEAEAAFVRDYVAHAERLNVAFDPKFESMIVDFVEQLKLQEKLFVVDVGPRLVLGIIRLAKAFARARLARRTGGDDVEAALKLVRSSLETGKE